MALFLQILVIGITTGAIYALIALGYTMVYGIIELINFAHGDIFMIGTFVCVSIFAAFGITSSTSAPTGLALVGVLVVTLLGAMAICAVLGVVIERFAYRPLRNAPRLAPLITAIGSTRHRGGAYIDGWPAVAGNAHTNGTRDACSGAGS